MFELISDDATWQVVGKPSQFLSSGTMDKPTIYRLLKDFLLGQTIPEVITFVIVGITTENIRVAIEASDKHYHFLLKLKNGKICSVEKYSDTIDAREIFERMSGLYPDAYDCWMLSLCASPVKNYNRGGLHI